MSKFRLIAALASLATVGSNASPAAAKTWVQTHPRQHQVLAREHHQIARINQERREGELTRGQASALRVSYRAIARQDHADARANGGPITRQEQRQLNHEQKRPVGRNRALIAGLTDSQSAHAALP